MAARKESPIPRLLAAIAASRSAPRDDAVASLREALASREPMVAAQAAEAAGDLELRELEDALTDAFERFEALAKRSIAVAPMQQIARALGAIDADAAPLLLRCLDIQVMVGRDDAAEALRAEAVRSLARVGHGDVVLDVARKLYDGAGLVRATAARALGGMGGREGAIALQGRLFAGDLESDVVGACVAGLVVHDAKRYGPLAAQYLASRDERLAEAVALAFGEGRVLAMIEPLATATRRRTPGDATRTMLLALALMRDDAATTQLFEILADGDQRLAEQAIEALALHRHARGVVEKVEAIVARRGERSLAIAFEQRMKSD